MRNVFWGLTGAPPDADRRAMDETDTAANQPAARPPGTVPKFDHAAWWLDAATGGEYLDDRIRVREPGD